jgi:DNA-binding NtrC family response regulator
MSTILIIDDEASFRKMTAKLLLGKGFDVVEAIDGNQGLELFKKHRPDLVITDIVMPDKEGLETIKELRKLDPEVKIIAISGGGIVDPKMYLDLASKFGAIRTFAKPFDSDILLLTIKEVLS